MEEAPTLLPSHHAVTPRRAQLLARQDLGVRFGGGGHSSRATVTGPNPEPQSWLTAGTNHTLVRTLTLTLTLKP